MREQSRRDEKMAMPTVCPVSAEVPTEELRDKVTLCAEEPLEDFCGRHSDRTTRVNTIKLCPLCQPGRQNVPWGTSRASVPLALGRCEWIQSGPPQLNRQRNAGRLQDTKAQRTAEVCAILVPVPL